LKGPKSIFDRVAGGLIPLSLLNLSSGQVAQLVEQWTENPCVGGSIPSLTTIFSSTNFLIDYRPAGAQKAFCWIDYLSLK
jgi:hypothetical protein